MDHDQRAAEQRSEIDPGTGGGDAPGKQTLTSRLGRRGPTAEAVASAMLAQLSRRADPAAELDGDEARAVASSGFTGGGGAPPHLDVIQRAFGRHDVSSVRAHVGGAAAEASEALGARAYASGDQVAFAEQPDTFLVAHELAHVVQQRGGVQLSGGVGQAGDVYEQHADAVAAAVVRGESAEGLLDRYQGATPTTQRVQLRRRGDARGPGGDGDKSERGAGRTAGGTRLGTGNIHVLRIEPVNTAAVINDIQATLDAQHRRTLAMVAGSHSVPPRRVELGRSGLSDAIDIALTNPANVEAGRAHVSREAGDGMVNLTFRFELRNIELDRSRTETLRAEHGSSRSSSSEREHGHESAVGAEAGLEGGGQVGPDDGQGSGQASLGVSASEGDSESAREGDDAQRQESVERQAAFVPGTADLIACYSIHAEALFGFHAERTVHYGGAAISMMDTQQTGASPRGTPGASTRTPTGD